MNAPPVARPAIFPALLFGDALALYSDRRGEAADAVTLGDVAVRGYEEPVTVWRVA